MRMTGSSEPWEIFCAAATSPFSSAANSCSSFCGSRLRLSRSHQKVRSPMTATATKALARIGHMTGPPLEKNSKTMFASMGFMVWVWLIKSVQLQLVGDASLEQLIAGAGRQMPAAFDEIHRGTIEQLKPRRFLHIHGNDISRRVAAEHE